MDLELGLFYHFIMFYFLKLCEKVSTVKAKCRY